MTPLEAFKYLKSYLQMYDDDDNPVDAYYCEDVLKIIEKALEEHEQMTKKKIVDELLCPTIKNFNYKLPKVDEIVISFDRKKIEKKYPSLRGSWDFSTMLIKLVEGYEKEHKKI